METPFPMSLALLLLCADPAPVGPDAAQTVIASSPLPAGHTIGSHYGWRTSARTGRRTFHAGTDFLAARGTPVYAVRHGVVERVISEDATGRRWAGYGNAVVVHHPEEDRWSFYAHLDSVAVTSGQAVGPGELLGAVGNTTQGRFPRMVPHLHLELRRARGDGSSPFPGRYQRHNVDPEDWLEEMGVRLGAASDGAEASAPVLVTCGDLSSHDHTIAK